MLSRSCGSTCMLFEMVDDLGRQMRNWVDCGPGTKQHLHSPRPLNPLHTGSRPVPPPCCLSRPVLSKVAVPLLILSPVPSLQDACAARLPEHKRVVAKHTWQSPRRHPHTRSQPHHHCWSPNQYYLREGCSPGFWRCREAPARARGVEDGGAVGHKKERRSRASCGRSMRTWIRCCPFS